MWTVTPSLLGGLSVPQRPEEGRDPGRAQVGGWVVHGVKAPGTSPSPLGRVPLLMPEVLSQGGFWCLSLKPWCPSHPCLPAWDSHPCPWKGPRLDDAGPANS